MGVILRIFLETCVASKITRQLSYEKNFVIVTGLCAGREESQTQKSGIDHLR